MRSGLSCFVLLVVSIVSLLGVSSAAAQNCTINFDAACPDVTPECGATFSGGLGCVVAGLGNCYDTGARAYRATNTETVVIALDPPISEITVFFAHTGASIGTMTFFDAPAGGSQVGTPFSTNGDCSSFMPDRQTQAFGTSVHRIEVTTGGTAWIDTMELTPDLTPTLPLSWGLIKTIYE